jgi:glutathione reductase (NADPH)
MDFDYDLFVIGAGSGGLAASKRAASFGAKVAIAEEETVGGTCVMRGCVPKKFLVYGSRFPALFHDARGYGWTAENPRLNWEHLTASINREVKRLSALHISFLEKSGVDIFFGRARFIDSHTIAVNDRRFRARRILVAVGGQPVMPDIEGVEFAITSREMFQLKYLPQHIVILGGGYIGCEFACIMHSLGSQVTQIIRRDQILHGFDQDIVNVIQDEMQQLGIRIVTNARISGIQKHQQRLNVRLEGSVSESIEADEILVATGRAPNMEGLGLEKAGIEVCSYGPNKDNLKAIQVNDFSQTSQPHIFAVGDVTNRLNLTPVAIGEGRAFADTEFGGRARSLSHMTVPSAVFTSPEAATVGLTEAEARDLYGDDCIKTYRTLFKPMYYSLTGKKTQTMMKLVVMVSSERVLGAHMVGDNAAEIIQGIAIAVKMGAKKSDFDATIGIHPTAAEEFVTLR